MITELILSAVALSVSGAVGVGVTVLRRATRHPSLHMWQWGQFTNHRPGIKNDHDRVTRLKAMGVIAPDAEFDGWEDEPDEVEFVDFRYWLRLKPNPGFNLPKLGYWSKHRGRQKPIRPWEGR